MSDKVIPISNEIYPIDTILKDLNKLKDKLKDLVVIVILEDETAYVAHSGLPIKELALACKLMDKEFSNVVDVNTEG